MRHAPPAARMHRPLRGACGGAGLSGDDGQAGHSRAGALAPGPRQTCSGSGRPARRPRVRARGRALRVPERSGGFTGGPSPPRLRRGAAAVRPAIPRPIRRRRIPADASVPHAANPASEAAAPRDQGPARGAAPGAPSRALSVRQPPLDHAKLEVRHPDRVRCGTRPPRSGRARARCREINTSRGVPKRQTRAGRITGRRRFQDSTARRAGAAGDLESCVG